ncbi:hypothetical protein RB195_021929 [Necator americanus]|uniref:Reverse transcriptase domain-containing protein n=1 Tax=Necator americanus TaxID=51031 RepID=A0ABR1ED78_NECAM
MNRRTTAAVQTPAGCSIPFEVETGVSQEAVVRPFPFNVAVSDIMRRTVEQCHADVILAPSIRPLVELKYAHDVALFASSSARSQHVVNLASKLAAAYGLLLCPYKRNQMWIFMVSMVSIFMSSIIWALCRKKMATRERDIQQGCAKASSPFI